MRLIDDAIRDTRYAARVLRRSPGFTATAVLSLALGIGANTAIFSVIDALMLRTLPVDRPDELVVLVRTSPSRGMSADYMTYPAFERFRDAGVFANVTASMTLERAGVRVSGPEATNVGSVIIGLVSGNYFTTFGVRPGLGRVLTPEDDRPSGGPVAVISDAYWRRQFGASPDAVGRIVTVNATSLTIVGVAQPGFGGENIEFTTDLWTPVALQSAIMPERPGLLSNEGSNWIRAIARVKRDSSVAHSQAAARTIFSTLPTSTPPAPDVRLDLRPAARGFSAQREFLGPPLEMLAVVVGLVLLIACANVGTLLMARAAARQKEIALRLSIGARRERLVRQLVTESLLIAAVAGAIGLAVGIGMTRVLIAIVASGRRPLGVDVHADGRVLAVTAAVSLLTGLLFGVVPAIGATRVSLAPALTGSGDASRGRRGILRAGRVLVAAQVAASVVLTAGAGLFVRTLHNLETQEVGFDREDVWMFWMAPMEAGRQGAALEPLFAAAEERIPLLPGVHAASPSSDGVLSGFIGLRAVAVEGHPPAPGEDVNAQWNLVGLRFFETIGMRLLAGRDFGPADTGTSPKVAVVNAAMAQHFFGDANPIGRRFGFGRDLLQTIEVVGVVQNAKYFSARDTDVPMVFLPYRQDVTHLFRMCLVVRASAASPDLVSRVRDELRAIEPAVAVRSVTTTGDQLERTLSQERLTAWLSGFFGLLAVLLACIGLYGVMSYTVARRTREIGIRVALGERARGVLGRVLRESLRLVAIGVVIGVPATLLATRGLQAMLFGISPTDAATIAAAASLLCVVATLAALVPARRAARVDPIVALRAE